MSRLVVPVLLVAGGVAVAPGAGAVVPAPVVRSVSSSPAVPVGVLSCLRHRDVKPADHVLSCATANVSWTHVTWSRWAARSASGKGDLFVNDCTPRCAKGRFTAHPATVRLSRVRTTKRYGRLFSRARITYSAKGARRTLTFGLLGPLGANPPRVPLQTSTGGEFLSPLAGMGCEIDVGQGVASETYCQTFEPPESVTMTASGRATVCHPHGSDGCLGNPGEHTPTLAYGKVTGAKPFRCLSSRSGLVCTVSTGKGFVISLSRITRIRGY